MLSGGLRTENNNKKSSHELPLVSVITVVYNGEKTLEETILSVLNQSYKNIEYLLIDGVSTDRTFDIIKKYNDKIDYWISEPDNGIYDAMNKGIGLAQGDIIGLLNSDDWYEQNACSLIVDEYLKSPKSMIYGNMKVHYKDGLTNIHSINVPKKKENFHLSAVHPTFFVPSIIYWQYGCFNLKYRVAADHDFLLRIFENNISFKKLDTVITNFREGGFSQNDAGTRDVYLIAKEHGFSLIAIAKFFLRSKIVRIKNSIKTMFPWLLHCKRKLYRKLH
jgi:glycosyltransferase involved in cell wall biosynthesis